MAADAKFVATSTATRLNLKRQRHEQSDQMHMDLG